MRRISLAIVAALVATVFAASAIGADTAQQGAQDARTATTHEYVVVYDAAGAFVAEQAVIAAGGTVVDRNAEIDLMLVSTDNSGFAEQVRGAQGVTGVALEPQHRHGAAEHAAPLRRGAPRGRGQGQPERDARSIAAARTGPTRSPRCSGTWR